MMKKLILIMIFFVCSTTFCELYSQEMTYSDLQGKNGISIYMSLESYSISSFIYEKEEMHEISLSGIFIPNDEGLPNLPQISRLVAIPKDANINISIKSMEVDTLRNINIAPALKIQAIPEVPQMDYRKNKKIYETDEFYPQNFYEVSEITEIRGVNAITVGITPFQFNPVTQELIVVNSIELEVEFMGGAGKYDDSKYRSPWFDPILRSHLLNYDKIPEIEYRGKSSKDGSGCEYLIIIPNRDDFQLYAEQIKDFRTKQGIYTKIMRLDEMGVTTPVQIKTYIHNAYNTWDIPPVAVLLMGDHHTNASIGIRAETVSHPYSGNCISDNLYADVTGNNLPDMVLGRMAAETEADMAVLVSKFIEYERQPCMNQNYYRNPITALGWQTERWFQICSEVVGGYWRNQGKTPVRINAIYSGTPGTLWSSNQNTNLVINYFGPNGTGYIPSTPSILGGWENGTANQIVTAINNGAFALQHRDHGEENGWGEPAFKSSHISQLTNIGKMTYLFTINCLTGKFNNSIPCFGEVFHRHTYQGKNAGCVGFLGPTEVSYSFVNDVFAWGIYDLFDPNFLSTYGPSYGSNTGSYIGYSGNWMPAFGNVSGKYFLHSSSWPYNPDRKSITYRMFTAHSDVFLRLFTEIPQPIQVNHATTIVSGDSYFGISATTGVTIALTANGEILDVVTATSSLQMMNISPTLPPNTDVYVVCTGQNYLRYETIVPVVCNTGLSTVQNTVTQNTTWHTNVHVIRDIIIPNEVTLIVKSMVKCESNAQIIIQPGGKLIVDGGTLTNACPDQLWEGIRVMGNKNQRQLPQYQGVVELKNGAVIENARHAIVTCPDWDHPNFYNHSGGIIRATDATFRNNLRSVAFYAYTNTDINGNTIDNVSYFRNCTFTQDNHNILSLNPDANFTTHISLWGVKGVKFKSCTFENLTGNYAGKAIYTENAGFKMEHTCLPGAYTAPCNICESYIPNTFKGFNQSIDVQTTGVQYGVIIDRCDFENNKTHVNIAGNNNTEVIRSEFNLTSPKSTGLKMTNSSGFKIEENQFYDDQPSVSSGVGVKSIPGLEIENSGTSDNLVYRNQFTGLTQAICTKGTNGSVKPIYG